MPTAPSVRKRQREEEEDGLPVVVEFGVVDVGVGSAGVRGREWRLGVVGVRHTYRTWGSVKFIIPYSLLLFQPPYPISPITLLPPFCSR